MLNGGRCFASDLRGLRFFKSDVSGRAKRRPFRMIRQRGYHVVHDRAS